MIERWEKRPTSDASPFFDVVEVYYDEYTNRDLIKRKVTHSLLLETDADLILGMHDALLENVNQDAVERS
jgi:hypothetical protein